MSNINGLEYRKIRDRRFRVLKDYSYKLTKFPSSAKDLVIDTPFYTLLKGELTVYTGYEWDGATGAIDDKTILRGSCIHDVLCEMVSYRLIDSSYRKYADKEMIVICDIDGMMKLRKEWVYFAIRYFNKFLNYVGFWKLLNRINKK